MKLSVTHLTRYDYESNVRESYNEARLQPANSGGQACLSFVLNVLPQTRLSHYQDFYQNCVHLFEIEHPHNALNVEAISTVLTQDTPTLAADATPSPLAQIDACATMDRCYDFLQASTYVEPGGALLPLVQEAAGDQQDSWQVARAIMAYIYREFTYQPATTNVYTHMRDVLMLRTGVCQDFAHVMLGLCRTLKIPARYVSGYIYNGPADELKGAQATHAWVEVYVPGHGWCGLDPTNNRQADGNYIKVAVGRDYADVSPLRGTYRGTAKRHLHVDVLVTRLDESNTPVNPASAPAPFSQ